MKAVSINRNQVGEYDGFTKWQFGPLSLEALPVDNAWAGLVVLLLGDPHLLEGGERGKDGTTNPDGVLPLRRSKGGGEKY